jgi:predicted transposase YdaD
MELDPARMTLLTGFFETYLRLDETEERKLEEEMGKMDEKEASRMIELTTSWEEKGRSKGRIEGKIEGKIEGQAEMLLRLLKKRFKDMPIELENKVRTLSEAKMAQLAEAIFDLKTIEDVRAFLG